MTACSVFKKTSDDWYPNYITTCGLLLVVVTFKATGPIPKDNTEWVVCVWGNDDCGMEKFFTNEKEAWTTFLAIIEMETVSMSELTKLGLVSA